VYLVCFNISARKRKRDPEDKRHLEGERALDIFVEHSYYNGSEQSESSNNDSDQDFETKDYALEKKKTNVGKRGSKRSKFEF